MGYDGYVHWYVVRFDPDMGYCTHYWTGDGWTASARRRPPRTFRSLKEARDGAAAIPRPLPPRTRVWASQSRAVKTVFEVDARHTKGQP